jgi:ABC-type bacteriocin/lantibiotic exporter with double-glycine peptidase domain
MSGGARRRVLAIVGALLATGCAHARTGAPVAPPEARDWIVVPHVRMVAQEGDADCGPAALAMALGRWDAAPSPDAWQPSRGEPARPGGVSAGALRDEARRAGFQAFVLEGSFDDLSAEVDAGHPVIVGLVRLERELRTAHFAVVVGHDAKARRWLVADPALGVLALGRDALEADWARAGWVTLVLAPNAEAREPRAAL